MGYAGVADALSMDEPDGETYGSEGDPITSLSEVADLDEDAEIYISAADSERAKGQSLDLSKNTGIKWTHLEQGKQSLKFNDEGGNLAIIDESAKGAKNITLGGGGDAVIVDSDNKGTAVDIVGGKGDDSIVVRGEAPVTFDMGKGGEDKIIAVSDDAADEGITLDITLKNYKDSKGGIQTGSEDIPAGIADPTQIQFGDGKITINHAHFTFDGNNGAVGSTTFNLFDAEEEKQAVGFTHTDGGNLNVASSGDDYVLVGNWVDDKTGSSTITGGKGNDTVYAGSDDVINAGAGKNQVFIGADDKHTKATVDVSTGRTTINGGDIDGTAWDNSFDETTGDVLAFDLSKADVSFDSEAGKIKVKGTGFRAEVYGITANNEDGANYVTQLIQSGTRAVKAALAAANETISGGIGANYFKSKKGAVDFTNYDGDVSVDLSAGDWGSKVGGEDATFDGINQFYGGTGDTTLRGGDANETLQAGNGYTSLYGGGGRNLLVGYGAEDRDANVTFFVLGSAAGARNTIQGFAFLDDVKERSFADKIEVAGNAVTNVEIRGDENVLLEVTGSTGATESVLIEGAASTSDNKKNMYVTDKVIAQVSKNDLVYDGTANYFVATGENASITVDNTTAKEAVIWLGTPERDGSVYKGDIKTIDASGFDSKAELAGNELDNTIFGGDYKNSMWGGNGGNDLLVGGAGENTFFYANGNGNDEIQGVNDGDVIYFSGVTLEDITGADFDDSAVTVKFKDEGTLKVNEAGKEVDFIVGEQTFRVNGDHTGFELKE